MLSTFIKRDFKLRPTNEPLLSRLNSHIQMMRAGWEPSISTDTVLPSNGIQR